MVEYHQVKESEGYIIFEYISAWRKTGSRRQCGSPFKQIYHNYSLSRPRTVMQRWAIVSCMPYSDQYLLHFASIGWFRNNLSLTSSTDACSFLLFIIITIAGDISWLKKCHCRLYSHILFVLTILIVS